MKWNKVYPRYKPPGLEAETVTQLGCEGLRASDHWLLTYYSIIYITVCCFFSPGRMLISVYVIFLLDHPQFHLHGSISQSSVLVWSRGDQRWILEESPTQRSTFCTMNSSTLLNDFKVFNTFVSVFRSILRRQASWADHFDRQSFVDRVQEQQQLGGQRLLSRVRR